MKKLFAVLLCVECAAALSWSAACWSAPKVVKEITLPSVQGFPFRPRISGDWVVDVRTNEDKACASTPIGVTIQNVMTGKSYTVYKGLAGWPGMGGNLAAWTGKNEHIKGFCTLKGDRSGSVTASNLMLVDVTTWNYYLPPLVNGPAFAPVVWDRFCAYEGKGSKVWLLDLQSGNEQPVSNSTNQQRGPQIGNGLVVWEEYTNKRQIHGYKISTGEELTITDDAGAEHCSPYTDGKTVVWWGNSGGVWAYDVATGKKTQVSKSGFYADVDNGIVVYLKSMGKEGSAAFGYDLGTGEEFRISSGEASCGPSISDNRVIWTSKGKTYCAFLENGRRTH